MPAPGPGQIAGDLAIPESFEGGSKTVGSNEAVPLLCTQNSVSLTIQSDHDNAASSAIYVGAQDIQDDTDNAMHRLEPGQSISIPYNDTGTHWYVLGSTASLKVWYFFLIKAQWS